MNQERPLRRKNQTCSAVVPERRGKPSAPCRALGYCFEREAWFCPKHRPSKQAPIRESETAQNPKHKLKSRRESKPQPKQAAVYKHKQLESTSVKNQLLILIADKCLDLPVAREQREDLAIVSRTLLILARHGNDREKIYLTMGHYKTFEDIKIALEPE